MSKRARRSVFQRPPPDFTLLLSDLELRERLRARGREVAEQWRVENVAHRLEQFFLARMNGR